MPGREVVLDVMSVLGNGHYDEKGVRVTGVKLLTNRGVREIWSDERGKAESVGVFTAHFRRSQESYSTGK